MTDEQKQVLDAWVLEALRNIGRPASCMQLVIAASAARMTGQDEAPKLLTNDTVQDEIYSSLMRLMKRETAIRSVFTGNDYAFEVLSLLERLAHAAADS